MERSALIDRMKTVMIDGFELPAEKIVPTSRLKEDLELDSLDAVDMLVYIEDEFNVKVDIEKFKETKTLQDIYDIVFELAQDGTVH